MIDDLLGGNWRRQHHKVSEELRHFPGMTLLDANFLLIFLELFVYFRLKGTQCSSLLELWQRLGVARCWDCSFKANSENRNVLSRVFSGISLKEALPLRSTGSSMLKAISCKGNTQKRRTNVFGKAGSNFSVLFGKKGCS